MVSHYQLLTTLASLPLRKLESETENHCEMQVKSNEQSFQRASGLGERNLPRDSLVFGPLRSGRGVVDAHSGTGPAVINFETL